MKIAVQGQAASFHDQAAHQFFGEAIELIPCETFADVFAALESNLADHAMVAIENSLHGPVSVVYDLLLKHRPWIFGETYLRVHQCLIGLPGAKLDTITEVYSQAEALSQCEGFLHDHLHHAKRFEHQDTAGAVADVATWNDPAKAAIGPATAAARYGLHIITPDIETYHHNYTRFVALGRSMVTNQKSDKTSIVLRTAHRSGALYHALGAFDAEGVNLALLNSRPIVGQHQKYMFYLDFEASHDDPRTERILHNLAAQKCDVTVLGSYESAELPE